MRKYIHGYNIQGRGVVGIDINSWSSDELEGNEPIIITFNAEEVGYTNITSIENWQKYGHKFEKCKQIKHVYDETDWESLMLEEKKIVAKHFLVEKQLRDEVLTQEEQDDNNYFKIYNLLSIDAIETRGISNPFLTPKSIDYKKEIDGRLHAKYVFDSYGWLIECEYFEHLEISQNQLGFTEYDYSNPILKYGAEYFMKPDGYVGSRTVTRRWYRLDGSLDLDSKITQKFYEPMAARNEGRSRRQNLINNLIVQVVGLIIMTSEDLSNVSDAESDAIPFMKEVANGISDYYEYGTKEDSEGNPCKLVQDVMASNYSRLDNFVPGTNDTVTIRMFIISKLTP